MSPLVLTFALLPTVAAERISVKLSGGVYAVPVEINGALTPDFLLDTGAATVIIPADVALRLVRTGTIGPDDILGSGKYVLADGAIVENTKISLRTLQIGSRLLRNVQAAVGGLVSLEGFGAHAEEIVERHVQAIGFRVDQPDGEVPLGVGRGQVSGLPNHAADPGELGGGQHPEDVIGAIPRARRASSCAAHTPVRGRPMRSQESLVWLGSTR